VATLVQYIKTQKMTTHEITKHKSKNTHREVRETWFLHSYLCQLFWPPCCVARKCKHFTVLAVRSPIWC